jgi:hypothetical protein
LPLQNERVMIEEPLGPRLIEPVLIPDGAPPRNTHEFDGFSW